jgi:hypothetical protein
MLCARDSASRRWIVFAHVVCPRINVFALSCGFAQVRFSAVLRLLLVAAPGVCSMFLQHNTPAPLLSLYSFSIVLFRLYRCLALQVFSKTPNTLLIALYCLSVVSLLSLYCLSIVSLLSLYCLVHTMSIVDCSSLFQDFECSVVSLLSLWSIYLLDPKVLLNLMNLPLNPIIVPSLRWFQTMQTLRFSSETPNPVVMILARQAASER